MKCLIYTRVSTDDQTTENQINQLKEYAQKQEWEIAYVKTDVCSGSKAAEERAGLNEAFTLAHQKKYDVLLFWSLDRFSREGSRKTLEYLTRLDHYGVKWHSYTEQYISSLGLFADAIISMLSCLAKQERVRISERTKAGLDRVRSKGIRLGRPKTPQEVITRAISLRESGRSYAEIGKAMGISKARAYQLVNIESISKKLN
jgi:putative DNA-invertase from lambdoid prophage Rac